MQGTRLLSDLGEMGLVKMWGRSMPKTASSFFSILDPTLSSDGIKHPNGGLPYLAPENTTSIPNPVTVVRGGSRISS
jgi:hypothetical protein